MVRELTRRAIPLYLVRVKGTMLSNREGSCAITVAASGRGFTET